MNWYARKQAPCRGAGGMVATSQVPASAAGLAALAQGGTAADAAVAAAAALAVTEPTSNGIGGDCFALYYEAATRRVHALNGSGRAPAGATLKRVRAEVGDSLPPGHGHTVTVPGAVAGWCDLIDRFGALDRRITLAPAVALAEGGFPVAPITAEMWRRSQGLLAHARGGAAFLIDGRAPAPGERFANPELARVLERIARSGRRAFYQGAVADAIAAAAVDAGGAMTPADLARHTSTFGDSIAADFAGVRVHQHPPNGQGLTVLLALGILRHIGTGAGDPLGPDRLHRVIEALRLAFADARRYIADPDHADIPLAALLSDDYARGRAALFDPDRAAADPVAGQPLASSDTVQLCAVDAAGNACSFIQSNYMGFGTGIVPDGCGFTLHNRGHNFRLEAGHANAIAGGKRPYHTIIPGLLTGPDGALMGPFGVMGGFMQPQGHVQVLLAMLCDGVDPQAALERPRVRVDVDSGGAVALEDGIPAATGEALAALGHRVYAVSGFERAGFGRGQIILRDGQGWVAGSDPRADGVALAAR